MFFFCLVNFFLHIMFLCEKYFNIFQSFWKTCRRPRCFFLLKKMFVTITPLQHKIQYVVHTQLYDILLGECKKRLHNLFLGVRVVDVLFSYMFYVLALYFYVCTEPVTESMIACYYQ